MAVTQPRDTATFRELTGFLWSVADLLRGDYKQADYGKVILPLTVLRRLDCVLEPTKARVLERAEQMKGAPPALREEALKRVAGQPFYNTSKFDFERLKGAPNDVAANLKHYINRFSGPARDILDRFRFDQQIAKLDEANLLYLVVRRFAEVDLHPERVPNEMMGSIFEELIRRFSEASNESGESEIRRWILENDWLEAIVALPDQLFYNTGIHTYVWILTNRKSVRRRGRVQLVNAADLFRKMRKSLGNKRNEMGADHIEEITRIHGEFAEGPRSKIFDNEDFGYRKITVERPLRLNFQASPERIARLEEERAFQNLATSRKKGERGQQEIEDGKKLQERILAALRSLDPEPVYRSRPEFKRTLKRALDEADLSLAAPLQKAILPALSERDETAAVCTGKGGAPEPDTELRDTENVPLKEDVHEYFEREVRPFLSDAWIDEDRTKIGFEVPFTRHFYEYTPLRPLAEIEAEIRGLEAEIEGMLEEVLA
jgi:type I restriction-modification system DNA methylase subunit